MMRYLTPDSHPLTNGKKAPPLCSYNGEISNSAAIEGSHNKGLLKFRSPPPQSDHHESTSTRHESPSPNRGGDWILKWGQRKRARVSRSLADESSSSSALKMRQNKVQKRTAASFAGDKLSTMPPPLPPSAAGRSSNLRNSSLNRDSSGFKHIRNLEDRAGAGNGSPSRSTANRAVSRSMASKRSPTPEKVEKKISGLVKDEKVNGSSMQDDNRVNSASAKSEQETEAADVGSVGQKTNGVIEWPRIYVALSRKEKEEDFMSLRGTKLPHRPKKRAKNVDRTLQYCFPGMWLSDLTKSRYEVREKKCAKKQKRRGLKGMESMDSGSE